MIREIKKLKSEEFDVVIIGGGIHGVTIAREASLQGLKTALIEKNDFGSSTSANSLKVLHGGLRYLQHANYKRIRQSIRSRKVFQQVAPNLVSNVPFLVPTFGFGVRSKFVMKTAIKLYDIISADRNKNIPNDNFISNGKVLSKNEVVKILPGLQQNNLTGGAVWYESIANDSERLILQFVLDASDNGACIANYLKATGFIIENKSITAVKVKDELNNHEFEIRTKNIIVTAGPWLNEIYNSFVSNNTFNIPLTKAVNIVVNKGLFGNYAVGLEGTEEYKDRDAIIKRGKRLYFFVPLNNKTMIGTTYNKFDDAPDKLTITKSDLIEIIDEVNSIYPSLNLKFQDICFYHTGLLPMAEQKSPDDDIQPGKHSEIYDLEKTDGISGAYLIKSVKFTTAPSIAEDAVQMVLQKSGKKIKKTFVTSYNSNKKKEEIDLPYDVQKHLREIYGRNKYKIVSMINNNKQLAELVSNSPAVTIAEILYCIREEMAISLSDIILRRTGLGNLNIPSINTIIKIAKIMQNELKWDNSKLDYEIEKVKKIYSVLNNSLLETNN
ncbi:aerobic glycerol-3-phosphate dehydrogenase [bacterium BMS3Abin04]|nr:aerobic glycerol-3-phosphate dehydrogenase [bacterium BMS3Abin04]